MKRDERPGVLLSSLYSIRMNRIFLFSLVPGFLLFLSCGKQETVIHGVMEIVSVRAGNSLLQVNGPNKDIPVDSAFILAFSHPPDGNSAILNIRLVNGYDSIVAIRFYATQDPAIIMIKPEIPLRLLASYNLRILSGLKGSSGEAFRGASYPFTTLGIQDKAGAEIPGLPG
jgi:hypothetical protein